MTSKVLLSLDVANAFRKLCRYERRSHDDMLEALMKTYVKTSTKVRKR